MLLKNYITNRRKLLLKLQKEKKRKICIDKKINNILQELKSWDKILLYEEV